MKTSLWEFQVYPSCKITQLHGDFHRPPGIAMEWNKPAHVQHIFFLGFLYYPLLVIKLW